MTTIEPIAPGPYARNEDLVEATRDHDRGRIDDDELARVRMAAEADLVRVQLDAGFTRVSTGQLAWQDLFRPFTAVVGGLEPKVLTRFLDTNTFYRRPDIVGEPAIDTSAAGTLFEQAPPQPEGATGLVALPSPTAFVTAGADEDGTYPEPGLAETLGAKLYPSLFEAAASAGFGTVVLSDPWLTGHPEPDALVGAIGRAVEARGPDGPEVLVHLAFSDAGPVLGALATTGVDGVVVDLTLTDVEALAALPVDTAIGLGVVDARSSLVEQPGYLAATVAKVLAQLGGERPRILIAPTGDLQHVPEAIARRKLDALGAAAAHANATATGTDTGTDTASDTGTATGGGA